MRIYGQIGIATLVCVSIPFVLPYIGILISFLIIFIQFGLMIISDDFKPKNWIYDPVKEADRAIWASVQYGSVLGVIFNIIDLGLKYSIGLDFGNLLFAVAMITSILFSPISGSGNEWLYGLKNGQESK